MNDNSNSTMQRLKGTLEHKSGCTPAYLRVLKSDLLRLLNQYMAVEDLEFSVSPAQKDQYNFTIAIKTGEFFFIGKTP